MQIRLNDGRHLGYAEYGERCGRPLLYFHGLPSSRLEAAFCDAAARRLGIRIIAADRPGCGLSDLQPRRSLCDWPGDVLELTQSLGIERFAVLGVSGGGPYALACAWKIPDKLTDVKIVCGLAPLDHPGTLPAMRWHARLAFGLAQRSYPLLWLAYGVTVSAAIRLFPATAYSWQRATGSPADRAVLERDSVKAIMLATLQESVRQGVQGPLQDVVLYAHDWGFRLEDIDLPVALWHGEADRIVPPYHARFIAGALARSSLKLVEGEGHYSLPIGYCGDILA